MESYVFILRDDNSERDRFTFDGPYDAGYELAQQRAALYSATYIHVEY